MLYFVCIFVFLHNMYRDPFGMNLTWWVANHPSWIMYECDKTTPAGLGVEQLITLDITNPDVIGMQSVCFCIWWDSNLFNEEWQFTNFAQTALNLGYNGMAADNFALGNAVGSCGKWDNGQWVQMYNGGWADDTYVQYVYILY
jgi:hypothetical protein